MHMCVEVGHTGPWHSYAHTLVSAVDESALMNVRCIWEALIEWLSRLMSLLSWCLMTHPIVPSCIVLLESLCMSLMPHFCRHCPIYAFLHVSLLWWSACPWRYPDMLYNLKWDCTSFTAGDLCVNAESSPHDNHGGLWVCPLQRQSLRSTVHLVTL
jgi:hypothetical protein